MMSVIDVAQYQSRTRSNVAFSHQTSCIIDAIVCVDLQLKRM